MTIVILFIILALVAMSMLQRHDTPNFIHHQPTDQQTAQCLEVQLRQWEQMHQTLRARERRRAIESTLMFVLFITFLMFYFAK